MAYDFWLKTTPKGVLVCCQLEKKTHKGLFVPVISQQDTQGVLVLLSSYSHTGVFSLLATHHRNPRRVHVAWSSIHQDSPQGALGFGILTHTADPSWVSLVCYRDHTKATKGAFVKLYQKGCFWVWFIGASN